MAIKGLVFLMNKKPKEMMVLLFAKFIDSFLNLQISLPQLLS